MASVEKWQANREKVTYAKSFPGLLSAWSEVRGKRVETVVPVDDRAFFVLIFDDKTFLITGVSESEPAQILEALRAARHVLEPVYPEAYRSLDQHTLRDKELTRKARLENILGAIRNNLAQIPELPSELEKLLNELKPPPGSQKE